MDSDQISSNHREGRIKFNVGGKLFETTVSTVASGGDDSLLAALSSRPDDSLDPNPIFIDRDPEIFSVLLSLLRSDRLPSAARRFSAHDLVEEAQYYGLEHRLRAAMAPPPLLGADASLASEIRPASDGYATALSAGFEDGSVWIAHGGQISAYDWSLAHAGTVRTHLDEISSLRRAWPEIAAVGGAAVPGLHLYDVSSGRHAGSVHWSDATDPRVYKAKVLAIAAVDDPGSGDAFLYASFECPHRENCILTVDRTTLKAVAEIGRQSGGAAKFAAAGKVVHVADRGLVFATAVSRGAFGCAGYVRLWDPRVGGEAVWESCEPGGSGGRFGDALADADVELEGAAPEIYKVCWKSGDVGVADLRMLGEARWTYLEEPSSRARVAGGAGESFLMCYRRQVFVSREGGLEVWSRVARDANEDDSNDGEMSGKGWRRSYVDTEEEAGRGMMMRMEGGGDRLFVSREGMEGVEVWESSNLSGAIPLS